MTSQCEKNRLLSQALQYAATAIQADKNWNLQCALSNYLKAADVLNVLRKNETNPQRKLSLEARLLEYIQRAEEIKAYLKEVQEAPLQPLGQKQGRHQQQQFPQQQFPQQQFPQQQFPQQQFQQQQYQQQQQFPQQQQQQQGFDILQFLTSAASAVIAPPLPPKVSGSGPPLPNKGNTIDPNIALQSAKMIYDLNQQYHFTDNIGKAAMTTLGTAQQLNGEYQISDNLKTTAMGAGKSALELEKEYNLMEKLFTGVKFCAGALGSVASGVANGAQQYNAQNNTGKR